MQKQRTIKQRAKAIIDDDRYDEDTRSAIRRCVETNDPQTGEFVRRAEQGEMISDLITEREKFEKAASLFVELFNSSAPDWLTGAMLVAASRASEIKRVPIYKRVKGGGEDFDVKGLADLFLTSKFLDLEPRTAPAPLQRVADALSELLCNPETPGDLVEAAAQYVTEATSGNIDMHRAVYWKPDVLRRLLDYQLGCACDDFNLNREEPKHGHSNFTN